MKDSQSLGEMISDVPSGESYALEPIKYLMLSDVRPEKLKSSTLIR
jgi:hypothetical protein